MKKKAGKILSLHIVLGECLLLVCIFKLMIKADKSTKFRILVKFWDMLEFQQPIDTSRQN